MIDLDYNDGLPGGVLSGGQLGFEQKRREEREGSRKTPATLSNPATLSKRDVGEKDDRDDGLARCDGARADGRRASADA